MASRSSGLRSLDAFPSGLRSLDAFPSVPRSVAARPSDSLDARGPDDGGPGVAVVDDTGPEAESPTGAPSMRSAPSTGFVSMASAVTRARASTSAPQSRSLRVLVVDRPPPLRAATGCPRIARRNAQSAPQSFDPCRARPAMGPLAIEGAEGRRCPGGTLRERGRPRTEGGDGLRGRLEREPQRQGEREGAAERPHRPARCYQAASATARTGAVPARLRPREEANAPPRRGEGTTPASGSQSPRAVLEAGAETWGARSRRRRGSTAPARPRRPRWPSTARGAAAPQSPGEHRSRAKAAPR